MDSCQGRGGAAPRGPRAGLLLGRHACAQDTLCRPGHVGQRSQRGSRGHGHSSPAVLPAQWCPRGLVRLLSMKPMCRSVLASTECSGDTDGGDTLLAKLPTYLPIAGLPTLPHVEHSSLASEPHLSAWPASTPGNLGCPALRGLGTGRKGQRAHTPGPRVLPGPALLSQSAGDMPWQWPDAGGPTMSRPRTAGHGAGATPLGGTRGTV